MSTATTLKLNNPRTVRAWYLYDWANSVYSLVITSAIFPVYYKAVAVVNGSDQVQIMGLSMNNSVLYTYALSFSFLVVAAILPLLSGVADYTGKKKYFMLSFVVVGSLSCMGLFFFTGYETLALGIGCSILASIGYSGSLVFYDAFLPEIVTSDRFDITSARGYSMGYYGSVIMMVGCVIMIQNHESFGFVEEVTAVRTSFLLVGVWWLSFALISSKFLPDNPYNRRPAGKIWSHGYAEVAKVWKSLDETPDLKKFLIAFFFYNMGVQTIMYLAALFGTDVLRLPDGDLIKTVLLIQLVGSVGAGLFARLSRKNGNRQTLSVMILLWVGVCVAAYFITLPIHFYLLAVAVGMIMGGIQSLSRATYSKLIPQNAIDHASYFSFYDVTYNLSIVLGTFSFGLINQLTENMRNSALVLAIYFIIGLLMLRRVTAHAVITPTPVNNGDV